MEDTNLDDDYEETLRYEEAFQQIRGLYDDGKVLGAMFFILTDEGLITKPINSRAILSPFIDFCCALAMGAGYSPPENEEDD
jgi:hypothetical protein